MREYAVLSPKFWTGQTGRTLRGDSQTQTLAFYLITSPHANMIGLYYLPKSYICHDTGIPLQGATKGLRRLAEEHFAYYDGASEYVWILEMARWQVGEQLDPRDKRTKGIQREYDNLNDNPFLEAFYTRYAAAFMLTQRQANHSPLQAPCKPLRSQDQDQEQDQEQEQDLRTTTKNVEAVWPSPEIFIALYNANTPKDHPKITVLSPQRKKKAAEYLHQFPEQSFWLKVFAEIGASAFLRGQTSSKDRRPIKRGLDWLLQKGEDGIENCVKTFEGKYRNDAAHDSPSVNDGNLTDKEYRTVMNAVALAKEIQDATPRQPPFLQVVGGNGPDVL